MFDDDFTKLHYLRRARGQEAIAESYRQWLLSYEGAKMDRFSVFMERKLGKDLEREPGTI